MSGRERILRAAARHFGFKPYSEVSIAPILADAEVQAPTLYYHFRDKEGLYEAWAAEAFASLHAQLNIRHQTSLEAGLAAFSSILFIWNGFDISQVVRDLRHLSQEETRENVYGQYFQSVYEPLCAILIGGMEKGELAPEPIGRIADVFLAGVLALQPQAEKDPAGTAAWYVRRFLHGHHPPG